MKHYWDAAGNRMRLPRRWSRARQVGHARVSRAEQSPSGRAQAADGADDLTNHAGMGNHRYPAGRMCGGDAVHGGHTTVAKLTVTLPSRPTEFLPVLTAVLPPQLRKSALHLSDSVPVHFAAIDFFELMRISEAAPAQRQTAFARCRLRVKADSSKWRQIAGSAPDVCELLYFQAPSCAQRTSPAMGALSSPPLAAMWPWRIRIRPVEIQ